VTGTKKALVRPPSPRLAEGIATHIERQPFDVALAHRQWDGYVQALAAFGWEPVEVAPADDCPDGVFVEDTLVVFRDAAVIARPGAGSRRPEVAGAELAVMALGYTIDRIESPGTLDGGDVLKVGDTIYVGTGGRTNVEGSRRLRAMLEPRGATVIDVPIRNVLHLKSALTALPDGSIIGYPPLVEARELFTRFVAVPEASGANVVLLGGTKLLLAADCPKSAELFAGLGYEPVTVDIGEFQKLEGGVTCLSVRLRQLPA
jgi:dimethylargininase